MEKSTSKAHVATALPIGATDGTGSALFVINLCASIAPARLDGNNIPGLENYRLYQVARVEDGRTRHRLRLGFFTSESHAESVLTVVRQQYPTAFTTCLCEEDRRFARGYLPEAPAAAQRSTTAVPKPAPAVQPKPMPAAAPVKQAAVTAPAKQAPPVAARTAAAPSTPVAKAPAASNGSAKPAAAKATAPADPEVIELTWEPEQPKTQSKAAAATPARKPPAVSVSKSLDEFTWEPPSLTPAAASAVAKSTSDTAKHPMLKAAPKTQPVIKAPLVSKALPVSKASPVARPAAPTVASPTSKPDPASSMRVRALELSISEPPPAASAQSKRTAPAEPFHVGRGVQFADVGISLQADLAPPKAAPAQPAATPAKAKNEKAPLVTKPLPTPAQKVAEKAAKPGRAPLAAAKPAQPTIQPPMRISSSLTSAPELDSTQTIRALTSAELDNEQQEKWFAVQLAVSEQPVNLDAMPRLDIFEAYRLYSVATAGSGKIVHSLRLGFFKEAVSAEAVSGYLKTFFGSPSVMRVSVAEHERFKDPPSKKPAAHSHDAKIVELSNARAARPVVPTVTMEVIPHSLDTAATGSFRPNQTGSFNVNATGSHKAFAPQRSATKSAGSSTNRAGPGRVRTDATGKHKALPANLKKSLAEQLLDEAREVELSESGIRKLPKNDSLLSRMLGKLTK